MTEARKICLLGDFAVGKTSLVRRFVSNSFGERYLTTVGVKIDTKEIVLSELQRLKLVIWDLAGASKLSTPARAYVQGSHGFLVVCDGTRKSTLESALGLLDSARAMIGLKPAILLVNKQDLSESWEIDQDSLEIARKKCSAVYSSSAKTGANVERAFHSLGSLL
jgi:small GTP-binding protein